MAELEKSEIIKYAFFATLIALLFSPVGSNFQVSLILILIIELILWIFLNKKG